MVTECPAFQAEFALRQCSVITENVRLNPAADAEWTRGRVEARVRGLARPPAEAGQPRGLRRHQGGGAVRRQVSGWRP